MSDKCNACDKRVLADDEVAAKRGATKARRSRGATMNNPTPSKEASTNAELASLGDTSGESSSKIAQAGGVAGA